MVKKIINYTKIECKGTNIIKFVNFCNDKNIELSNIVRTGRTSIECYVTEKQLKSIQSLKLNYEINILERGGWTRFKHKLLEKAGVVVGLIASIVIMCIFNNRLINIDIIGLNNISKDEVISSISNYGINKFSSLSFDYDKLEGYLIDKFDFSFVSIISNGNTLIISVKEELPDVNSEYVPIIAEQNMVIKSIEVFAGTSKYKSGDLVYKGDIIVEPYYYKGENKISIKPSAKILADSFITTYYNFLLKETKLIRTGKSKNIESTFYIGKNKLFSSSSENKYINYELCEERKLISNYIMPIYIYNTVAYELKETSIERDFEKEKEEIVNKLKIDAHNKLDINEKVENEDYTVNSTNNGYVITYIIKINLTLSY